jgi:hypothetical protein
MVGNTGSFADVADAHVAPVDVPSAGSVGVFVRFAVKVCHRSGCVRKTWQISYIERGRERFALSVIP